jgi:SAM-dependent methyltransferase
MADSLPTPPSTRDVFAILAWFQACLYDEAGRAVEIYGAEAGGELAKYYGEDRERYLAQRQHEVNRYTRTRENFILRRVLAADAPRILDCGCGLGSEAILFASQGARVTGVDLKPARLAVAELRRERYARLLGRPLAIEYRLENLFDLDYRAEFDLIWVKEAISHIHPLPDFYAFALRALRPGGQLVISDPNAGNLRKRRSVEARRHGPVITTFPHPRTGVPIPYADERILTIAQIREDLVQHGFRVAELECYLPGQSSTPLWFWKAVMRPLNHCQPLTLRLGDEYIVAAVKPA